MTGKAVKDPVAEARIALREAIARNVEEPSESNRAECSRLGLEYRKAVEARNAKLAKEDRVHKEFAEAIHRYTPDAAPELPPKAGHIYAAAAAALIALGALAHHLFPYLF